MRTSWHSRRIHGTRKVSRSRRRIGATNKAPIFGCPCQTRLKLGGADHTKTARAQCTHDWSGSTTSPRLSTQAVEMDRMRSEQICLGTAHAVIGVHARALEIQHLHWTLVAHERFFHCVR
eukprot:6024677-Prymnesium_polylepis.4